MDREAAKKNMTEGSLWDKLFSFALPLAATGILQQLFNAADIAVVGRCTGEAGQGAMAAVGANSPIIGLIVNAFVGISLGTNVVIANAIGRGDRKTTGKALHTSVVIAVIGGIFLALGGELFAERILGSQKVPEDVLPMAVLYFRVYMTGIPVVLLYNFLAAVFRASGDTRTPLVVLVISGSLNVVLNLIFVLGLKRTVDGVAAATVISSCISAVLLFVKLMKAEPPVRLELKSLGIDGQVLKKILAIGIPAGVQSAVFSFANIIIQAAINSLGTVVMAASSAAFNIEIFAYDVFNSFSQACTTFVGQNYGAGRIDRCRRTMALCMVEGSICLGATILLILFFGRDILSVFNPDPAVIEVGYQRLVIIFSAYFFSMSYEVLSGYLRGFGISVVPAIITMLCICGTRISWIYLVFPKDPSFKNVMLVYPISLAATAVLMLIAVLVIRPAKKHMKQASA